ncbi:MAG: hypothetical protein LRZ92_00315 [Methanosarcinaceae archaeon]|nr:hypothetical protein [Methanosarcinaceae archaeon]
MIKVEISAIVNPTEDVEKVKDAILFISTVELNLHSFGGVNRLSGEGGVELLENLHTIFRNNQILDTARTRLNVGQQIDGTSTEFILSKQVATVEKLNFPVEEEPLGSIYVTIKADSKEELERVFNWLAPNTEKGIPIDELDIECI